MSFQEWIEQQIHAMMLDLTDRIIDGEFGDMSDEELDGLAIFVFKVENCLLGALRLLFAEKEEESICSDCGNRGSTAYEGGGYDAYALSLCNSACEFGRRFAERP